MLTRWLLFGVVIGLLVYLYIVNDAQSAPTPTPMQKKDQTCKAEEQVVKEKIALAYKCGYGEARTKLVDRTCMEFRDIASANGFLPKR